MLVNNLRKMIMRLEKCTECIYVFFPATELKMAPRIWRPFWFTGGGVGFWPFFDRKFDELDDSANFFN